MIDWTKVTDLRYELGAENFHEMVGIFVQELDEVIGELDERVELATLPELLVFMTDSSDRLGFSAFAEACRERELALDPQGIEFIDVEHLIILYCESRVAFWDRLPFLALG